MLHHHRDAVPAHWNLPFIVHVRRLTALAVALSAVILAACPGALADDDGDDAEVEPPRSPPILMVNLSLNGWNAVESGVGF